MHGITAINHVKLPFSPIRLSISKSDLYSDSTKRSAETGRLLLYLIRKNIYTLEVEYLLNTEQKKFLESLIEGAGATLFVQFDENGETRSLDMYLSDRSIEVKGTENSRKYSMSFSLIQI